MRRQALIKEYLKNIELSKCQYEIEIVNTGIRHLLEVICCYDARTIFAFKQQIT